MKDTKEQILTAALHLFAKNGYEGVSMREIAQELGMTKGALYRHYASKRAIFESIVERMRLMDAQRAGAYALPKETLEQGEDAYRAASLGQLAAFSRAQFVYWTQEDFPASFRRMLTLEQYRSDEMRGLYQQYLVSGPLGYVADLFHSWNMPQAHEKAVSFYAPMFLFFSLYDGAATSAAASRINERVDRHFKEWVQQNGD